MYPNKSKFLHINQNFDSPTRRVTEFLPAAKMNFKRQCKITYFYHESEAWTQNGAEQSKFRAVQMNNVKVAMNGME